MANDFEVVPGAAEGGVDVDRFGSAGPDEDHPVLLGHRNLMQVALERDVVERSVGHRAAGEGAVELVGPGVVRADDAVEAAAMALDQGRARWRQALTIALIDPSRWRMATTGTPSKVPVR